MYILNFYENYNQLKTSVASSNLDDALSSIKNIASLYVNGWHKEHELVTFRIEVINQKEKLQYDIEVCISNLYDYVEYCSYKDEAIEELNLLKEYIEKIFEEK